MKHTRNTIAPLLIGPVLMALGGLGDQPQFGPAEGHSVSKRIETKSDIALDDMSIVMNGNEAPMEMEMSTSVTQVIATTDEYVSVADGRAQKLKRTFDELSSATAMQMSNPMTGDNSSDMEGSSDLQGLTVVFEWDDAAEDYSVEFADDSGGDEELLEGLLADLDLAALLPPGDVGEGEPYDVEPNALRAVFTPGGQVKIKPEESDEMMGMGGSPNSSMNELLQDFDGEVIATFEGVRDEDGVSVAVIALTIEVGSANDLTDYMTEMMEETEMPEGMSPEVDAFDLEFSFDGTGELLWNMEAGILHSIHVTGDAEQIVDTTMKMEMAGQEMELEQSMTFSGTQSVTITTES